MPAALIALMMKKMSAARLKDCGDDRDEVRVDLETAKKPTNHPALQNPGGEKTSCEKAGECSQAENRYIVAANVEERPLQKRHLHVSSVNALFGAWQPRSAADSNTCVHAFL